MPTCGQMQLYMQSHIYVYTLQQPFDTDGMETQERGRQGQGEDSEKADRDMSQMGIGRLD